MRTALILLITVAGLVGALALYSALQPKLAAPRSSTNGSAPATAPILIPPPRATTQGDSIVGSGENVWVKTYDEKTGHLAFQLRASRYDPRPDGNAVDVKNPQAEVFLGSD